METLINAPVPTYPENASGTLIAAIGAGRAQAFAREHATFTDEVEEANAEEEALKAESAAVIEAMNRGEISVEECRAKMIASRASIRQVSVILT